jgi:tetratricopeptide (TPR) repeat protein
VAADYFRRALQKDPEFLSKLAEMARQLESEERFLEAAGVYRDIFAVKSRDPAIAARIGAALLRGGRPDVAVGYLERSVRLGAPDAVHRLLQEAKRRAAAGTWGGGARPPEENAP